MRGRPARVESLPVLDGVTLEVNLRSLGNEALATLLAAAANDVAARFRGHAGTEAVLVFASALGGLISPFHLFRFLKWLPKCPRTAIRKEIAGLRDGIEGRENKFPSGKVNESSGQEIQPKRGKSPRRGRSRALWRSRVRIQVRGISRIEDFRPGAGGTTSPPIPAAPVR